MRGNQANYIELNMGDKRVSLNPYAIARVDKRIGVYTYGGYSQQINGDDSKLSFFTIRSRIVKREGKTKKNDAVLRAPVLERRTFRNQIPRE